MGRYPSSSLAGLQVAPSRRTSQSWPDNGSKNRKDWCGNIVHARLHCSGTAQYRNDHAMHMLPLLQLCISGCLVFRLCQVGQVAGDRAAHARIPILFPHWLLRQRRIQQARRSFLIGFLSLFQDFPRIRRSRMTRASCVLALVTTTRQSQTHTDTTRATRALSSVLYHWLTTYATVKSCSTPLHHQPKHLPAGPHAGSQFVGGERLAVVAQPGLPH